MRLNHYLLLILLAVPLSAKASAITSAQTGNWGSTSTWVGGTVPGNGDTVSIFHVITTTDTRTIGTSPGDGNIVINLNSTGTIVNAPGSILNVRGDVIYTAGNSNLTDAVVDSGTFKFDASVSSAPSTIRYRFYPSTTFGFRAFRVVGSSTTHAVLRDGALTMNGQAYGGGYIFLYADIINMNLDSFFRSDTNDPPKWDVTYSSFNNCGPYQDPGGMFSAGIFRHEHNQHINSKSVAFDFRVSGGIGPGGVRSIQYNVFDTSMSTNGGYADFTISYNYMNDIFEALYSTATFAGNFVRARAEGIGLGGNVSTSYFLLDADFSNPHLINGIAFSSVQTYDGLIFGQSGVNPGDSGEIILFDATTVSTRTVSRSIFLPDGEGYQSSEITAMLGNAQYTEFFNHNTYFGGKSLGATFAAVDYSETGNAPPGAISGFKNNLLWNPEIAGKIASYTKIVDIGNQSSNQGTGYGVGPTTDVCSPSNCDYNSSYGNLQSTITVPNSAAYHNQGRGYAGNFSSTPGVHDLDNTNPSFTDYHRYAEAFDRGYYRPYVGLTSAPGWVSSSTYSVGTVVNHSTSTIYWGDTIDYRYTNGTGCSSANPEPGGTNLVAWEKCWEFATFQDIRDSIISSATFTDSTIGVSSADVNTTLISWVRTGYAPTNFSLKNAGSDGTDIGAVPILASTGAWLPPTQAVFNNSCAASSSCSVSVSAIGAGHLLVVLAHIGNLQTLSSVTAAGETFTVIPAAAGAGSGCPINVGGNHTQMGCAYVLSSVGGATSVTCNWNGTASATNTSCGVYEVPYTAQSIYLENNAINASNVAASTFTGANFGNSYTTFINGVDDILFQMTNVSTGTPSSINSAFVLDNSSRQVADSHILNSFSNTPPIWTNSTSTTSFVSALSFGVNFTSVPTTVSTPPYGLIVSSFGVTGDQTVTVTLPGQFKLVFESSDAWGIAQWYNLFNDTGATTNLLAPAYGSGSTDVTIAEPGLFQRTYYDFVPGDTKQFARPSHYYFPNSPRSLTVIEAGSGRVIIETRSVPSVTSAGVLNNMVGTSRYYIYPNGKIYVQFTSTLTNAGTITSGNLYNDITLEDPTQTGTNPPDTRGWTRASTTQNPYTGVSGAEPYLFEYWNPATTGTYTNYTQASVMIVHSPNNLHDGNQIIHSWGSAPGYGVVRWGWSNSDNIFIPSGGTETESALIQLGAFGSSILPNIISTNVAGPIAAAYIANPVPPAAANPDPPLPIQLFPSSNVWNTNITSALVSSSNTLWVNIINGHAGHNFHPNFGGPPLSDGSYNGIPYNLVWSSITARTPVTLGTYATESDTPPVGGVPIPLSAIVENDIIGTSVTVGGDQHLLIVDVSSGMTYEMFVASRVVNSSSWTAAQLTIWYSTSNVLRTAGWTSADAGGLPVTEGLLRYEEVSPICNITHAIRMELTLTHGPYIWPARHDADSGGVLNPPFGMRVRMKPGVDLSGLSTISQCIFNAAKRYGFILADNGGDWYIDGMPDSRWDDDQLHTDFITVGLPLDTMEVIDESTWIVDPNSAQAQQPNFGTQVSQSSKGLLKFNGGVKLK